MNNLLQNRLAQSDPTQSNLTQNSLAQGGTADRISSAAIDLMLETADMVGVDLQTALGGAERLPSKRSVPTHAAALSPPQLAATFHALIAELCARSPQRDAQGAPSRDDVDLFCYCLINCDNLGAAIERAIRFTKISNDRWGELGLYEKNGRHFFFIDSRRHGDTIAPAVIDVFSLSYFYRLFSWLIAEPLPLLQVSLAHARCIGGLNIQHIFGCPVAFDGTATALVFASAALKKPIVRTYDELVQVLQSLPIALMPLPRTTSVRAQVEMIFQRALSLHAQLPGLETVAQLLNQSVSTLRRNLLREDTSFQAVMDRLRMQRSMELLAETELTIDDIADILGFSAPSVFSRAFKGWTGCPPSKYRLTMAMQSRSR